MKVSQPRKASGKCIETLGNKCKEKGEIGGEKKVVVSLPWHSAYKRAQNVHQMFTGVNLLPLTHNPCLQKLAVAVSIAPRYVKTR